MKIFGARFFSGDPVSILRSATRNNKELPPELRSSEHVEVPLLSFSSKKLSDTEGEIVFTNNLSQTIFFKTSIPLDSNGRPDKVALQEALRAFEDKYYSDEAQSELQRQLDAVKPAEGERKAPLPPRPQLSPHRHPWP